VTTGFGLIEKWEIVRKAAGSGRGAGRMVNVAVTLSDWLFRAVLSKSVLTLSRDYFRLRKPLERRIYELSRKHCGRQVSWTVSVETLLKKSGSASPRRVFRKMLRDMIAAQPLPDYTLEELPGDLIRFSQKNAVVSSMGAGAPMLKPQTLEAARDLMPGADVYALEADWRAMWARMGGRRLRSPDAAFLGWVRKRAAEE
jgi:plasmid replication initiation protein